MVRGYWLDKIGGLKYGDKFYGDVELSKTEYDALFYYAPEHRAQALPLLKKSAEYDEVSEQNTAAVIAEVSAHDDADKAAAAAEAALKAYEAALAENPEAPADELQAALKTAQEARAAAEAASAVTAPLQEKLQELRTAMEAMPPRREISAA